METLAAVGLAGNIVQFVQFSFSLVSKTSEIHRSGSDQLHAHEELDLVAKELSLQCAKMQQSAAIPDASSLASLASACKQVSDELIVLIANMKRKLGSTSKWSSFRQALKGVLKSEEIKALTERIERFKSQMNQELLICLTNQQHKLSTMMYQLKNDLQLHASKPSERYLNSNGGEGSSKSLGTALKQNAPTSNSLVTMDYMGIGPNFTPDSRRADIDREKMIEQVLKAIRQTRQARRVEHDDNEVGEIDEQHLEGIKQCATSALNLVHEPKILQSLTFDMMQFREAIITRAHSGTFNWLLRSQEQGLNLATAPEHVRLPFIEWLEHNNDTFWIAGKPGSGKSTLMKHILNDPKTRQHLETWAGDYPLVIAGYFFWHRGNDLQRSQQGLLQSLLYAIFQATPGLANQLCPARIARAQTPWTLSELESIFEQLGHGDLVKQKFCFFIDGLDEYSGDHFELVENLQSLASSINIKMCLASRPWPCFEDTFGKHMERRLYLQYLTKPDTERYVREKLELARAQTTCDGDSEETEEVSGIVNNVVEKSQGVFLWVTLVVRSLREGLTNGDSITTLRERVHDFPADLEPFFFTLLQSVEPKYQRIMAITFLVAVESTALPLVTYSILEEEDDFAMGLAIEEYGLLECWDKKQPMGDYRLAVEFLHRSVRDFLQTAPIQSMLHTYVDEGFDAYTPLCRIRLAQLKSMPQYQDGSLNDAVGEILHSARLQQVQNGFCDFSLLYQVGETIISRPDIAVGSVAEYLGMVARKGLYVYLQEYLTRNPKCLAGQFSSISYLVARYITSLEPEWSGKFDVQAPAETLSMARMLLQAGSRPSERIYGTSGWAYLISFVCNSSRKTPQYLDGIIEPLLQEFISHGARFDDLVLATSGAPAASLLLRAAISHVSALNLLEGLFKHGCDPETVHLGMNNSTIWSTILAEVAISLTHRQFDNSTYEADALVLCLKHGANKSSTRLHQILESPQLSLDEKARIRAAMTMDSGSQVKKTRKDIFKRLLRR